MSERRILNNRLRRQKERRKNILLFVMAVCLAFSVPFSAGSFLSSAKDNGAAAEHKYYASIPVQEGDTLWSIAEKHMGTHYDCIEDYIREIRQINSLNGENIQAGMYIIVPYYTAASSG